MQPMPRQSLRLLCLAEMKRLNDRAHEFCAEVRRHEDVLRDLYPAIAGAFRMARARGTGANDNGMSIKRRPHP